MEKWKLYTASKRHFTKKENTMGFIIWETYQTNFKIECWNMENPKTGNTEPTIVQFWQDGNGYVIYRQESNK